MAEKSAEISLPLEIVILFLDELRKDRAINSLATCSLVCKVWLDLIRPHLFAHLHLSQTRLDTLIHEYPGLFDSPYSTITTAVQSLKIIVPTSTELRKAIPLLKSLTNVQRLHFGSNSAFFHATGNFPTKPLANTFPKLVSLELGFDFPDFKQMADLVCSFPALEVLHLRSHWEGPVTFEEIDRLPPSLTTLKISESTSHVLRWFNSFRDIHPIRELDVEVNGLIEDIFTLNRTLILQALSLRRLIWRYNFVTPHRPSDGSY